MKTSFSFGLILLVGFLLWMTSCDKVDAPYRTTTSVGVVYINNDTVVIDGDTLGFNSDNTNPGKKVLAEDYTGILCGNCPYAGIKLNDTIQPAYGDRLVVVSVLDFLQNLVRADWLVRAHNQPERFKPISEQQQVKSGITISVIQMQGTQMD